MMNMLFLALLILTWVPSAFASDDVVPRDGAWRGEFDVKGAPLPFNFELKGADGTLTLINGSRRDEFKIQRRGPAALLVPMNTYDAALEIQIESPHRLVGAYKSKIGDGGEHGLRFVAEHGKTHRFFEVAEGAAADLAGTWALDMESGSGPAQRVALLNQQGVRLSGVVMSVTGDSRELVGDVRGNRFYLSGFSGPSPVLFTGAFENGSLAGSISYGTFSRAQFKASRSAEARLPDAYSVTHLKPGYQKLEFSFPDLQGQPVSLADEKYRGKVVLVEIIGSWCPNCADQAEFLAPWFKQNRQRGVEIIAIGFEFEDDLQYARGTLGRFRDYFDIQYDVLFGGLADKQVATQKLPALNAIAAFPTTVFIDRAGRVREIHAGYTGKATGEHYDNQVARFNDLMNQLLAEPNPFNTRPDAAPRN